MTIIFILKGFFWFQKVVSKETIETLLNSPLDPCYDPIAWLMILYSATVYIIIKYSST